MLKQRLICIIGIWIMVLPYIGIPLSWKKILFFITGLITFGLGYLLYRERRTYLSGSKNHSQVFVEHKPQHSHPDIIAPNNFNE
jgi:hypothetical protein